MMKLYLPKSEVTKASSFSDVWIFFRQACMYPALLRCALLSNFCKDDPTRLCSAVNLAKFLLSWLASSVSDGTDYQILIFGYKYEISKQ